MARKYANEKEKELLRNEQEKALRKLKAQQGYREDARLEIYGFDSSLFVLPDNLTVSDYKQKMEELQEFRSKQYRLVNIGGANKEYIPSNKFQELKEVVKDYNRFNTMRQESLKEAKKFTHRVDENGNLVIYEMETPFEQTEEGMTYQPLRVEMEEMEIGRTKKGISSKILKVEDEVDVDKIISKYRNRAKDFGHIRIQQLEDNFFKGLSNSVSPQFSRSIRKQLDDLGIDAIDFLYLYDTTAVFKFDFIYDVNVDLINTKEAIKSEVQKLREGEDEGYIKYRQIVNKYEEEI